MIDLNQLYEELLSGKTNQYDAGKMIADKEIQRKINVLINKERINDSIPYTEDELQFIQLIINITQFIYNNSGMSTGIDDNTYDTLYSIMVNNGGADIVSAPILPSSSKKIAHHKYPQIRGTLKKIYYLTSDEERKNPSRKYLDEWIQSTENLIYQKIGRRIDLNNEEIYVFPKFDGISAIFEMNSDNSINRVLTRGYTTINEAEDITSAFRNYKRECQEFESEYGLKTEVMMKNSDLEKFNKRYGTSYKQTRSIVSGILTSDEVDDYKLEYLHVVPLRVVNNNGVEMFASEVFKDYPFIRCRLKDREKIREFANEHKLVNGELRTDGAVICLINEEIKNILGRENDMNKYEVAYKFTEESAYTTIKDIEFTLGLFGQVTPVAKVKKITLKGNDISSVSLGSMERMRLLGLKKGDTVKILYDIIPYLVFDTDCRIRSNNNDGKIFEVPTHCPICGSELIWSENYAQLSCNNPKCESRVKGKILNYLQKLNIKTISFATINTLYEYGFVKSIKDLYSLRDKRRELISLDGFGDVSVDNMILYIENMDVVDDYVLLGALGIKGIGRRKFKKVMEKYSLDELLDICKNNDYKSLVTVQGVSRNIANDIIEGINDNRKLIKFLDNKLTIISTATNENKQEPLFSVCFTKIRDNDKEKFVIDNNGEVVDSLTRSTTFLVVPSLSIESSKMTKARKYGTKIVHIDDLESAIYDFISSR